VIILDFGAFSDFAGILPTGLLKGQSFAVHGHFLSGNQGKAREKAG
jgi:hypothetical protein